MHASSRRWAQEHVADIVDVFVYVVILNLAIEFFPSVISETFLLSLLTAVLLKFSLEVALLLKGRVINRMKDAQTRTGKVSALVVLWVVAAGSKLVVLWLIELVFRGTVSLGGFVSVTLLVLSLLAGRYAVRRLLF